MRRSLVQVAAATATTLAVLTGCDSAGHSAPAAAPGSFDPAQAVANASKEPYAVSVKVTGGPDAMVLTARQNVNTLQTGHREQKDPDGSTMEFITTADAEYMRGYDASGRWKKIPKSNDAWELDFTGYAPLLLAQGNATRKGMESRDGVPVYHLAGHLGIEQVAGVTPEFYRATKSSGVTGFDLDQWIDAQGRTRYVEEAMVVDGATRVIKATYSDFGPAETFTAPPTDAA